MVGCKYGFLKNVMRKYNDGEGYTLLMKEEEQRRYEYILDELIKDNMWDIVFKYMKVFEMDIYVDQTREDCLNFLRESCHPYSLKFIIKQDDELILESLKRSLYGLKYIRIPLKKETLVEIDLLYSKGIEKKKELKVTYMALINRSL